jgi:cytochrome oxidase Cu insertion factor (SCO1/SenC/PrrC family)
MPPPSRRAADRPRRLRIASACSCAIVAAAVVVVVALSGGFATGNNRAAAGGPPTGTGTAVGQAFPAFRLTGTDGRPITNATVAGEKTLVWFTDVTCPPASAGDIARLDTQLGHKRFRVLVVFLNTDPPAPLLTAWRNTYARPDWLLAKAGGTTLAGTVKLSTLDTRYLLDAHGRIITVTNTPDIDDAYLAKLRAKVAA